MVILEEEPSIEAQLAVWHAKRAAILAKYAAGTAAAHPSTLLSHERGVTLGASIHSCLNDLTIEDPADSKASRLM